MGVLYAKVDGSWVPILNSTGPAPPNWPDGYPTYDPRYVNASGDAMTGILGMNGAAIELRDAAGTRTGYIRQEPGWAARITAETGPAIFQATVGVARVHSNVDAVTLVSNGTETARASVGSNFLVGKITDSITDVGVMLTNQWIGATNAVVNTPLLVLNKTGAGVGPSHDYAHFRTNNTNYGSITRNASQTAVLYNTTSDYRLKNDRGPITDGSQRVMQLIPRRVTWKLDPTRTEVDGFFAHEVAEVAPDAVTGEKDAVADADDVERGLEEGDIIPQQMDSTRLIPLLTAALQDALTRIEDLTARVAQLEAA